MLKLNLPEFNFTIKKKGVGLYIFDSIRGKYIRLTPEEWVRQNIVQYFVLFLFYPKGLIAIEKQMKIGNIFKRFDVVIFNPEMKPLVLIECKAPNIDLNQEVFDQIFVYNKTIKSKHLVITNGLKHYCFSNDEYGKIKFLNDFPAYRVNE